MISRLAPKKRKRTETYCKELFSLARNGKNDATNASHPSFPQAPSNGTHWVTLSPPGHEAAGTATAFLLPIPTLPAERHPPSQSHKTPWAWHRDIHTGIFLIQDQPKRCLKKWFILSLSGIFTAINSHHGLLVHFVVFSNPAGWAQSTARSSKMQHGAIAGAADWWKRIGPSWEQPALGSASSLPSQARLIKQSLAKPSWNERCLALHCSLWSPSPSLYQVINSSLSTGRAILKTWETEVLIFLFYEIPYWWTSPKLWPTIYHVCFAYKASLQNIFEALKVLFCTTIKLFINILL